ncbi:hypothetical protein KF7HA_00098 [Lactococcus lactis]|nr:hypothetical protein [Lactococcus lactis]
MEKSSNTITFKKSLKDSSLAAATLLVLRMIHKLLFNYAETKNYFHQLFSADNLVLALFVSISTVIFIWIIMSFIFGIVYYTYRKIKNKLTPTLWGLLQNFKGNAYKITLKFKIILFGKVNSNEKIFFGLVAVLVMIIGAGCGWYKVNYGTIPYYVQLTQDGKSEKITYNDGTSGTIYRYNLTGYDKSGKSQQVKLIESRILKHDAYLKAA